MNKLSFSQKNDLVVKHKGKKHFWKDLELFQKHYPSDRLMNDLAKANEFTFERLDGQMLYLLLDKVSIEEILSNREGEKTESQEQQPVLATLANEKLKELSDKVDTLSEDVEMNESNISDLRSELENKDASIEALEDKIIELETKNVSKKKESKKNSKQ